MKIDFDLIPTETIPNFKGGEGALQTSMYIDGNNKIMRARLAPGSTIGMHCHEDSSEIIFIQSGIGTVLTKNGEEIIPAGQCHYCMKGQSHSLCNRGDIDLEFLAVVPQHG